MQFKFTRPLVALGIAAALALPAGATAKSGHAKHGRGDSQAQAGKPDKHGKKPKGPKYRALVLKGTVTAVGTGTIDVLVRGANHHGRALRGQTVTVDVSGARVIVRDVNGDGIRDLADVAVGDRVGVQARIAKGTAPDPAQPIVAKRVLDVGPKKSGKGGGDEPPAGGDEPPAGGDEPPADEPSTPPAP